MMIELTDQLPKRTKNFFPVSTRSFELKGASLFFYLFLCRHVEGGKIELSIRQIADQTKLSRSAIHRAINNLTSLGFIRAKKDTAQKIGTGFIYVLQIERRKFFKIGCTRNPAKRIADLNRGGPFKLIPLWIAATQTPCEVEERKLHQQFKEKRVAREWFKLNAGDVKLIRDAYPERILL